MSRAPSLTGVQAAKTAAGTPVRRPQARLPGHRAAMLWIGRVGLPITVVHIVAAILRFWDLGRIGFNSDEAVYAGSAASIAGDSQLGMLFPVFRAHPVLLQMMVSIVYRAGGVSDTSARALCAGIGVLAVAVTYALGRRLYGHRAGLLAALVLAVMPYHVTVSRQVLLDGLMTLCATAVLYCLVRYVESIALPWLLTAGVLMGLTFLAKETSIVLLGGIYAFFALTPVVRLRAKHLVLSVAAMGAVIAVMPIVLAGSGRVQSGQNYLLWQLVRRPNHELLFYFTVVPGAVGWAVLAAAVAGLIWLRRENTWRERLVLSWVAVPVVFFTLWPVKGYQYLLPVAPVLAVLAGRMLARMTEALTAAAPTLARLAALARRWVARSVRMLGRWLRPGSVALVRAWRLRNSGARAGSRRTRWPRLARLAAAGRAVAARAVAWSRSGWAATSRLGAVRGAARWLRRVGPAQLVAALLAVVAVTSLAVPAWRQAGGRTDGTFLAGTGGLPGGREAGRWVAEHVPEGAQLLTIGPSMANVLQFYGKRRASALSVSPNPMQRNPSYVPIANPDWALRDGEFQYLVWDTYTAQRTPFFAAKIRELIDRYRGVAVFTSTISVTPASGALTSVPVVIIYQVRAA